MRKRDSLGVACPTSLPPAEEYNVPEEVTICLHAPIESRVLNYHEIDAISALVAAGDRRNRNVLVDGIPIGLSQTSFLADQDGISFCHSENSDNGLWDTELGGGTAERFKSKFYEMTAAVDLSNRRDSLQDRILSFFDSITAEARGNTAVHVPDGHGARRVSMLPPNKRNRVTHGTQHMRM